MADGNKNVYDESKIKTLSSLEHIRLRTGMYIGRIGDGSHYDDGCYILLKEVIDNAIDELHSSFDLNTFNLPPILVILLNRYSDARIGGEILAVA